MSDMDITRVLAQMRAMAAQAQGVPQSPTGAEGGGAVDFSEMLKRSVNAVNDTQKQAGKLAESFEAGDPNTDLTQVMIALQKANVSFQAMTQVRNKLVDAYNEIMRMSF